MSVENVTQLPERQIITDPDLDESTRRKNGRLVLMHIPDGVKPQQETPENEPDLDSLTDDEEWLVYEIVLKFDGTIDLPYAQKERHRHYLWNYCAWHVLNGTPMREIEASVALYVADCLRVSA